uniref:Exportin-2 n=1 Tax=Panagrolaimus superbus TaxID=310955 RepID=A0A914Z5Z3_9BILA
MNNLINVLQNTLSNNNEERKNAEQVLFQYSQESSYPTQLFSIIFMENLDMSIRFAAVTSLKNFIKFVWKEEGESRLSEDDRRIIRQQTFDAMFTAPAALAKQLTEALRIISCSDFPDVWTELIDNLAAAMQQYAGDSDRLFSCLTIVDDLCMKYRHELKSNQLWLEIKLVLDKIFMPLTELFVAYSNGTPMDTSRITNLTKMVSIYHSLLSQDLPEVVEDNLKPWINTFTKLFSLPDLQKDDGSLLDALWDEMCIVITVYAQRYEEEIQPYMQAMITLIWDALNASKDTKGSGQFTKSGLLFIATLAVRPHYQDLFVGEGIIEMLLGNVIWPNISYSDEDRDLLEDDPVAFFKHDLDGFDKETVRGAAVELLRALSSRFEEKVVAITTPVINSEVQKYEQNPAANWRSMNAVCSTIVAICSKTETQKYGATNVSSLIKVDDFCTSIILPELRKDQNHLLIVADAFKFIVTFRNQLSPEILNYFFIESVADKYLKPTGAENPILRLYAAFAIERLLTVKIIRDNKASLNQYLLTFSDNLIASLSQPMSCDNCYVLKCLYRCITYLQPETIASKCLAFTEIMQSLIDVALKKTILVDTLAVHFGFETICWFIKKAYILPNGSRYQFYHSYVFETIYNLLKSENRDFVPYALQLACALVEQYGHEIEQGNDRIPTDDYEAFFGNLINSNIADSGTTTNRIVWRKCYCYRKIHYKIYQFKA